MSSKPNVFLFHVLGLPFFSETSVDWEINRLVYRSHKGHNDKAEGVEQVFQPSDEQWDTFWAVLEKLRVWEWEAVYENRAVMDGAHWSLTIEHDKKRLSCRGSNAYPPGYQTLHEAMNWLAGGTLITSSWHVPTLDPDALLAAAEQAGRVHDGAGSAVPKLIETLKNSWDDGQQKAALDALAHLGLGAVPAIPAILEAAGNKYGILLDYAPRDTLEAIEKAVSQAARDKNASDEWRLLVEPVIPAITKALLERQLRHEIRQPLLNILRYFGISEGETADAVIASFLDPNEWLFKAAYYALEPSKTRPTQAVPTLLKALEERLYDKYGFSEHIIRALHLFDAAPQAVPILLPALTAEEARTRALAAQGLGLVGAAAAEAVPSLMAALDDSDQTVRWRAAEALGKLGTRDAVTALVKTLRDIRLVPFNFAGKSSFRDENVHPRERAATALGKIHAEPDLSIPALIEALHDSSRSIREKAAYALEQFDRDTLAAIPEVMHLAHILRAKDNPGHREAARILGKLGPDGLFGVRLLMNELTEAKNEWDRQEAAKALENIGAEAKAAIPTLLKSLEDVSLPVRIWSARALHSIDPAASEPALPVLITMLKDKTSTYRQWSAEAFITFGKDGTAAVPALVEALSKDSESQVRANAAKALGSIGVGTDDVITALTAALGDTQMFVFMQAARALRNIDPQHTPTAVAGLIAVLTDHSNVWRSLAADVLGEFGQDAQAAVPALTEIVHRDKEEHMREAAEKALAAITAAN